MMGTLITDPNAPPDPTQIAPIPDEQHPAGSVENVHNPVTPGVPPSADYPIGIQPQMADAESKPPALADVEMPKKPVMPDKEKDVREKGETAEKDSKHATKKK